MCSLSSRVTGLLRDIGDKEQCRGLILLLLLLLLGVGSESSEAIDKSNWQLSISGLSRIPDPREDWYMTLRTWGSADSASSKNERSGKGKCTGVSYRS